MSDEGQAQGSPGPDDEVWCVVHKGSGYRYSGNAPLSVARRRCVGIADDEAFVARWDAEGLRWIEAPAPTIMVEVPLDIARTAGEFAATSWWADACRAALEREGLT